jgi:chromosome segregation ATPase
LQGDIEQLKKEIEQHLARIQNLETQLNIKTNELNSELVKSQQLEKNLAESEKVLTEAKQTLTQSQQKITHLETQVLNYEQLKEKHITKIEELQQELSQSQVSEQQLSSELGEVKESLSVKVEQLKKVRLEVVGLQARLKQVEKEIKPNKPVKSEPINP